MGVSLAVFKVSPAFRNLRQSLVPFVGVEAFHASVGNCRKLSEGSSGPTPATPAPGSDLKLKARTA